MHAPLIDVTNLDAVLARSRCLVDASGVQMALDHMAAGITACLAALHPVLISVMNGGLLTTAHLLTRLRFPLHVDSLHASRYHGHFSGADELVWHKHLSLSLQGRHVLLIDDVLDGGVTLAKVVTACQAQGPASLRTAVLVNKTGNRQAQGLLQADFVGLELGSAYIFGFGMDYQEYFRNLDAIYALPDF